MCLFPPDVLHAAHPVAIELSYVRLCYCGCRTGSWQEACVAPAAAAAAAFGPQKPGRGSAAALAVHAATVLAD
jgi:hypothetical protein